MKYQETREGRLRKVAQEKARREEARKEANAASMRLYDGGLISLLFRNLDRMAGGAR